MHRLLLPAALAGAAAIAAPAAAQTFPSAPPPSSNNIIAVRGFCGLGWHRGPYGACYRNYVPYLYRAYVYGPRMPAHCWWVRTAYGARRVCAW
jgi:hypothetical protein